jgi:hypothetical protein
MSDDRVPFKKKGLPLNHPDYRREEKSTGHGKADCPSCRGRGVTPVKGAIPPAVETCRCVLARDIARNVEKAWKGLMKAPRIDSSPLLGYVKSNLWVTARLPAFRSHLRHVAIRQGPRWFFAVESDADLMQAWLAKHALDKIPIFDPDIQAPSSLDKLTLADIAEPPALLIVHLGVKVAANREMANVLEEALSIRYHNDKPTWIFDQPYARLSTGHRCYSDRLIDSLEVWEYEHLELEEEYAAYQAEPFELVTANNVPLSRRGGRGGRGGRGAELHPSSETTVSFEADQPTQGQVQIEKEVRIPEKEASLGSVTVCRYFSGLPFVQTPQMSCPF